MPAGQQVHMQVVYALQAIRIRIGHEPKTIILAKTSGLASNTE